MFWPFNRRGKSSTEPTSSVSARSSAPKPAPGTLAHELRGLRPQQAAQPPEAPQPVQYSWHGWDTFDTALKAKLAGIYGDAAFVATQKPAVVAHIRAELQKIAQNDAICGDVTEILLNAANDHLGYRGICAYRSERELDHYERHIWERAAEGLRLAFAGEGIAVRIETYLDKDLVDVGSKSTRYEWVNHSYTGIRVHW